MDNSRTRGHSAEIVKSRRRLELLDVTFSHNELKFGELKFGKLDWNGTSSMGENGMDYVFSSNKYKNTF